jgi:dihydroxy-acid dehydratase
VFDGPEDYHHRIDDPSLKIDEHCMLFMRGTGPIGYPGAAEVVNMQPPAALIKTGITSLPCIGDGRQSGTSGSPSILNASPEAAAGGGLAILKTGDRVRIDLNKGRPTSWPRSCSRPPRTGWQPALPVVCATPVAPGTAG